MRVFLDANVLFSAAKSDGAVRELLRLLREGGHECCVDRYVSFEAHRNLSIKVPTALAALDALVASCHVNLWRAVRSRCDVAVHDLRQRREIAPAIRIEHRVIDLVVQRLQHRHQTVRVDLLPLHGERLA